MTTRRFIKTYRDARAADTAREHYRWLTGLNAGIEYPEMIGGTDTTLGFAHVTGRAAELDDLPAVAAVLGRLHYAARRAGIDQAQVNSRYITPGGRWLAPFAGPRRKRLHHQRDQTPDSPLDHQDIDAWLDHAALFPAAIYKDSNPRNFLITPDRGPVLVDFDSLTLAPVGYDLAKLLVTTGMTYGRLPRSAADDAVAAYTHELGEPCSHTEIAVWAEFHDLLTRRYLGRHGYRHPWSAVRPWPAHDVTSTPTKRSR
ncbi:phosphotransferase [Saccharopolyspora elongata]|nr:phosphotransferase [Saccharopolyspora elongata]